MSVILDALHKARSDRSPAAPADGAAHEQAVARVVDAATIATPPIPAVPAPSRMRQWLLPVAVIAALLAIFALVAAGLLLLYKEIRHSAAEITQRAAAPAEASAPPALAPSQQFVGVPVIMPTPMPLSELPVQAPPASPADTAAPATPALTAADFTLGSIVCENNDCLASLNGRSVRRGDTIKGYVVTEITPSGLKLKQAGGSTELTLSLFD